VELITRLRTEIPAFNVLDTDEQVKIVTELRLREFDLFKRIALNDCTDTPQRVLRKAITEFWPN
jgi:hypothetical protein